MRIESQEDLKTWAIFKNISVDLDQKKLRTNINKTMKKSYKKKINIDYIIVEGIFTKDLLRFEICIKLFIFECLNRI